MNPDTILPPFPTRPDDAHKGTVGRIVVVGGRFDDIGMVGAPAHAANAAFRTGAGLVQIVTPREAQLPVSLLAPNATTRVLIEGDPERLAVLAEEFHADVIAIGPGLSPRITGDDLLALLFAFKEAMVIDADALNTLSRTRDWGVRQDQHVVITPHSGELKRILDGLGIDIDVSRRTEAAEAVARRTRTTVVHKGAGSVVTDGQRTFINQTGHSGMATGGAGDVLTGIIAALLGQRLDAYDAAVLGTHLHGLAGEIAGQSRDRVSIVADDIIDNIGLAISAHRHRESG